MKFRYVVGMFLVLAAVLAIPLWAMAAGPLNITLNQQNNSGQSGTAVLTDLGNGKTRVDLTVTGAPAGDSEAVHIHSGSCPNPGAVVFPLSPLVNGKSTTEITGTLDSLTGGTAYAINGHKAGTTDPTGYAFCGNLTASAQVTGTATSGAGAQATTTVTATRTVTATTAATAAPTTAATTAPTTAPTVSASATVSTTQPSTLPTTGGDASGVGLLIVAAGVLLAAAGFVMRRYSRVS